jgi:adenylate cyclase
MSAKTFICELKRRNVFKVAAAYGVIAWLLIQAALTLLPAVEAPSWVMPAFVALLVLGFGLIVFISWAFEATPEGMKRTEDVPLDANLPTWSARKFATFIFVVAALAASLLAYDIARGRIKPASTSLAAPP